MKKLWSSTGIMFLAGILSARAQVDDQDRSQDNQKDNIPEKEISFPRRSDTSLTEGAIVFDSTEIDNLKKKSEDEPDKKKEEKTKVPMNTKKAK